MSSSLPSTAAPLVTIIRPVKGLDPFLLECLTSTFTLCYPAEKLSISLCVSSAADPALPLLDKIIKDHPQVDGRIFIEEQDVGRDGGKDLGPNPKIRNMSQAYQEARGDIIWILDCNVWVHADTVGLLVDLLCGLGSEGRKYKFVHHLPLAIDTSHLPFGSSEPRGIGNTTSKASRAGGLLEELFLSTAHAKFYTAIATAAVAPCTNGKSTIFRRSHLDALTQPSPEYADGGRSPGIDFFSNNICEDHLISDLLWRSPVPAMTCALAALEGRDPGRPLSNAASPTLSATSTIWGNHALLLAPPCIQPVRGVPLRAYAARRARWLRVRKFTVPAATAVEPGTESLAATTLSVAGLVMFLPSAWPRAILALMFWVVGVGAWAAVDRWVWSLLQERLRADAEGGSAPAFMHDAGQRKWRSWLAAWVAREVLAWPIWAWAIFGGSGVLWREKRFWVGMDMRVHEISDAKKRI